MTDIEVTCRCGWHHTFTEDQRGLLLPCPQCDRDVVVSDDEAELRNTNTGAQELAFADGFEVDDEDEADVVLPGGISMPTRDDPRGAPVRRRARGKNKPGSGSPHRASSGVRGAARGTQLAKRTNPLLGVAIVAIVGGLAALMFWQLTKGDAKQKATNAARRARATLDAIEERSLTAIDPFFASTGTAQKLLAELDDVEKRIGELAFASDVPELGEALGASFNARCFVRHGTQGYEFQLRFEKKRDWHVTSYRKQSMTGIDVARRFAK